MSDILFMKYRVICLYYTDKQIGFHVAISRLRDMFKMDFLILYRLIMSFNKDVMI